MLLAVDISNSIITIALFAPEGELRFQGTVKTDPDKTRDQIAIDLQDIFRLYRAEPRSVTGAILSSVVPPMTTAAAAAIRWLCGTEPLIVGPGIRTGLNILADVHNQLGADMVATSVGALQKYPAPIIAIDLGTATTLSYLGEGTFEGCLIIPGIRISGEALSAQAARLPRISLEEPAALLGRSTVDAMRAGMLYGNAGMIDNLIGRMEEENGPAATVVITGESAPLILPYCRRKIVYDETLILDGLYYLYRKNTERRKRELRHG